MGVPAAEPIRYRVDGEEVKQVIRVEVEIPEEIVELLRYAAALMKEDPDTYLKHFIEDAVGDAVIEKINHYPDLGLDVLGIDWGVVKQRYGLTDWETRERTP